MSRAGRAGSEFTSGRGLLLSCMSALAVLPVQAQAPATGGQVWSIGNLWVPLPSNFRALVTGEWNAGTDYSYQQWTRRRRHRLPVEARQQAGAHGQHQRDKESRLVVGAGYEYVWTDQAGRHHR